MTDIVVVEDGGVSLSTMTDALEARGFSVARVGSGTDGATPHDQIAGRRPRLVIVVESPHPNADLDSFVRAIRLELGTEVPIIVYGTTEVDRGRFIDGAASPSDTSVSMTVGPLELLDEVDHQLGGRDRAGGSAADEILECCREMNDALRHSECDKRCLLAVLSKVENLEGRLQSQLSAARAGAADARPFEMSDDRLKWIRGVREMLMSAAPDMSDTELRESLQSLMGDVLLVALSLFTPESEPPAS